MGGQLNTPALTSSGGTVPVELDEIATGASGTGAVGTETILGSPLATGAAGTGGVGAATADALGWGQDAWGRSGWGT